MSKDELVLVYYIPVGKGANMTRKQEAMREAIELTKNPDDGTQYYFPTEGEGRVECINPRLITEKEDKIIFNEIMDKVNDLKLELDVMVNLLDAHNIPKK
jgi:hypothetical protein